MKEFNFPYKAAIFDLDGTVIDSIDVWENINVAYLDKYNLVHDDEYFEQLKSVSFHDGAKLTVDTYHLNKTVEEVMQEWENMAYKAYSSDVMLKPGAKEYLSFLKSRGVKLAFATAGIRKLATFICQKYKLDELFETGTFMDEINVPKSKPDIYLLTAAKLGVAAKDCLVFEDILYACRGALEGGFAVQAIYDRASVPDHEEMKKLTGREIVKDFRELMCS